MKKIGQYNELFADCIFVRTKNRTAYFCYSRGKSATYSHKIADCYGAVFMP